MSWEEEKKALAKAANKKYEPCCKVPKKKEQYRRHLWESRYHALQSYVCYGCGKSFLNKYLGRKHTKTTCPTPALGPAGELVFERKRIPPPYPIGVDPKLLSIDESSENVEKELPPPLVPIEKTGISPALKDMLKKVNMAKEVHLDQQISKKRSSASSVVENNDEESYCGDDRNSKSDDSSFVEKGKNPKKKRYVQDDYDDDEDEDEDDTDTDTVTEEKSAEEEEEEKGSIKCPNCDFSAHKMSAFDSHQLRHINTIVYYFCPHLCENSEFSAGFAFFDHMKQVHKSTFEDAQESIKQNSVSFQKKQ